jgi:hypothetical protein
MPTEKLPLSNLDRLNRHVSPLDAKRYAAGGMVEQLMMKPRNMLFPQPPPFVPFFGRKYQPIPFGKPHA